MAENVGKFHNMKIKENVCIFTKSVRFAQNFLKPQISSGPAIWCILLCYARLGGLLGEAQRASPNIDNKSDIVRFLIIINNNWIY